MALGHRGCIRGCIQAEDAQSTSLGSPGQVLPLYQRPFFGTLPLLISHHPKAFPHTPSDCQMPTGPNEKSIFPTFDKCHRYQTKLPFLVLSPLIRTWWIAVTFDESTSLSLLTSGKLFFAVNKSKTLLSYQNNRNGMHRYS